MVLACSQTAGVTVRFQLWVAPLYIRRDVATLRSERQIHHIPCYWQPEKSWMPYGPVESQRDRVSLGYFRYGTRSWRSEVQVRFLDRDYESNWQRFWSPNVGSTGCDDRAKKIGASENQIWSLIPARTFLSGTVCSGFGYTTGGYIPDWR